MGLKTCSQNADIKVSKEQTHKFDASVSKSSKTGDGTNQFKGEGLFRIKKI